MCLKHALVNLSDFGKRYHTTQESLLHLKMHVFSVVSTLTSSKLPKKPNRVAKLLTSMVGIGQRATPLSPTLPPSKPLVLTNMGGGKTN